MPRSTQLVLFMAIAAVWAACWDIKALAILLLVSAMCATAFRDVINRA